MSATPDLEKSRSRLVIREIILQDFKSYGGRRTIGPFHECFSAIIGPNGSGKSNVIDALMFVFGKKAKKIRLSKLSELIHNPQKGGERPSSARVEVIFHEIFDISPGVYETVPESELVVAREVASNNSSKYIVNGRTSNWTDVTALFSSKGIDLEHNRFLILQGEVEQIAMMKAMGEGQHEEGLLEYLEDLIGSNQFIESINEKSKLFNELSEQRNEHMHRVKQAEKEKDALEGPRQEAEMYVKAATELLEAKCTLVLIQKLQVDKKIEEARSEVNEAALELDKVAEEIQQETSRGKDIESAFQAKEKEQADANAAMERSGAEFNELDKLDTSVNASKRLTQSSIDKELREIETDQKTIEKLKLDLQELTASVIPALEKEVDSLQIECDKENRKLDQLYESVHSVTHALKAEKDSIEIKVGEAKAEIEKYLNDARILAAERDVLLLKEKSGEELRAKSEKAVFQLEEQLDVRNKQLKEAIETEIFFKKKLEETKNNLKDCNREYELSLNKTTASKQRLEQAKSSLEQAGNGGSSALHSRIVKEAESGKLKGVHGRLGDLACVDPKFEIALAVALSAQAECVVVDSTQDAQAVVAFVKSNNLGRVTCIILDSVNGMVSEQSASTSSSVGIPRMIDLLSVKKPELKRAFWYAMRDTLVADTIEIATRIGLSSKDKRFRVVTLNGQLVDPSGAMTGGGSAAALVKGKNSRNAIDQIEKEIASAQADFEKSSVQFENARNSKAALITEKDGLEKNLEHIADVLANQDEIDQLKQQLEAERKRVSRIVIPKLTAEEHGQVRKISEEIQAIEKTLDPKKFELELLVAQVAKITKQIVEKAGEKTRRQKEIVDEAMSVLEAKKKELSRIIVERNKIDMKMTKCGKNIQSCNEELERLRGKLLEIQTELEAIENKAGTVMEEFTRYRSLADKIGIEKLELSKKFESFRTQIIEKKKKHAEVLNEINKMESAKADLEAKSREFSKQANSIRKEYKALPHELVELTAEEREERNRLHPSDAVMTENEQVKAKALLGDLPRAEIECLSPPEVQTNLVRLEAKMTKLHPNLKAIEEYRHKLKEFKQKLQEMEAVCSTRDEVRKALEFLRQERLGMFLAGFNTISLKVKEMYQMLTLGGDAELELVDTTDPFAKGISFSVRPPKKTWKAITQLSGGEKTLSSLSLVFALHYFKPTPLYFLDEIDAALDTRNVAIIANYIKQRATNAQFIIISLRNQMFELADWLVGIYKTDHVSKSVTLDPAAASAGLSAFKPQQDRPFYASPLKNPQLAI